MKNVYLQIFVLFLFFYCSKGLCQNQQEDGMSDSEYWEDIAKYNYYKSRAHSSAEFETSRTKSTKGTKSTMVDTDDDGMADDWETTYSLNSSDPKDAFGDIDGDSVINLFEFQLGSLPNNAASPSVIYVNVGDDLEQAIDNASAGSLIKIEGGKYLLNYMTFSSKQIMLQGGWNADFSSYDPISNPAVLDGQFMDEVLYFSFSAGLNIIILDGLLLVNGGGFFGTLNMISNEEATVNLSIMNSLILNSVNDFTGAVNILHWNSSISNVYIINSIIANNNVNGINNQTTGGANGKWKLFNSIITNNGSPDFLVSGLNIFTLDTAEISIDIVNSILWGNDSTDLSVSRSCIVNAAYSDIGVVDTINGAIYNEGTGVIDSVPLFYSDNNLNLMPGSPCIEKGIDIGLPFEGIAPDMGVNELDTNSFSDELFIIPETICVLNLTVSDDDAGMVFGGGFYEEGEEITIEAWSFGDNKFINWTLDDVIISTDSIYTFTITSSMDLVANFGIIINNFQECGDTLTDIRTGTQYQTVQIGDKCWISEDIIYEGSDTLNYSSSICQDGWELPSVDDWRLLSNLYSTADLLPGGAAGINLNLDKNYWTSYLKTGPSCYYNESGARVCCYNQWGFSTSCYTDRKCAFIDEAGDSINFANIRIERSGFEFDYSKDFCYARCIKESEAPLDSFSITAEVNPEGSGTVTGTGKYVYGTEITLTAIPADKHNFVNWTQNDNLISTDSIYTFTITSDMNLMANFSPIMNTFQECGDTLTDIRTGIQYTTVQIGNDCWITSDLFYQVKDTFEFEDCTCPEGWKIPTEGEWKLLNDYYTSDDLLPGGTSGLNLNPDCYYWTSYNVDGPSSWVEDGIRWSCTYNGLPVSCYTIRKYASVDLENASSAILIEAVEDWGSYYGFARCIEGADNPVNSYNTKFDWEIPYVYPNPAHHVLNIENRSGDIKGIRILSLEGKLLKQIQNRNITHIDISDLQKGVYIIQIEKSTEIITRKIVKQ